MMNLKQNKVRPMREPKQERDREGLSPWCHTYASSSKQSFVTGLSTMLSFARRRTEHTRPFASDLTSKIFPSSQDHLGAVAPLMRMMSPGVRLLLGLVHFCLYCIIDKYSEIPLFQKSSAMYVIGLHLFLMYRSL